jgi:hypothetical protein
VGGFPVIANGTPCADTGHDGMPDVWATARGFNPNNAADRNTVATNGYTNLENYLGGVWFLHHLSFFLPGAGREHSTGISGRLERLKEE